MAYASGPTITCPSCGHHHYTTAKFCSQCGTNLPEYDPHAPVYRVFARRGSGWNNSWATTFATAEAAAEAAAGTDRWKGAFVGRTAFVAHPEPVLTQYTVLSWQPLVYHADTNTYTVGEQPADAPSELFISGEE